MENWGEMLRNTLWVQRGTDLPVTFVNGNQFGARAKSNGTIEIYRNGILIDSHAASGWTYSANSGYIVLAYGSSTLEMLWWTILGVGRSLHKDFTAKTKQLTMYELPAVLFFSETEYIVILLRRKMC